jgi:hypothetical protein
MGAKLLITWLIIFTAIILENVLITVGLRIIVGIMPVIPEGIVYSDISIRFSTILYSALVTSGLSLIPLFFGMKKKSTSTTIIASVIISFLINGSLGNPGTTLYSVTVIPVLLCAAGVLVAIFSYHNIEKMDIN